MSLQEADGVLQVGTRDFPVNRGGLCQKGWTAAQLLPPGQRAQQHGRRQKTWSGQGR